MNTDEALELITKIEYMLNQSLKSRAIQSNIEKKLEKEILNYKEKLLDREPSNLL